MIELDMVALGARGWIHANSNPFVRRYVRIKVTLEDSFLLWSNACVSE